MPRDPLDGLKIHDAHFENTVLWNEMRIKEAK